MDIGTLIKNMGDLAPPKTKKLSDRAILFIKIAELTGMTDILNKQYWSFAGKFNHLKGEEGVKILNWMYEMGMAEDGKDGGKWRAIKFWQLLEITKIHHLIAKMICKLLKNT
jgi:hypothetical protein